ncbi:MAG: MBL fold metallo-hydrolase [Thermoguttaceae bacterium]|nr:MBL fold metallo-hydrolase [Thermoguttaceae bacterium]
MAEPAGADALFYPIASGSGGNAFFVRCGTVSFLVDCGISMRRVKDALEAIGEEISELSFILTTHAHIDHTKCVGSMACRYGIPVYASRGTWEIVQNDPRVKKVPPEYRRVFDASPDVDGLPDSVRITAFSTPHDAYDSVGYRIDYAGRAAAVATDLGYVSVDVKAALYGADLVLLESNHDLEMLERGPYPDFLKKRVAGNRGHLSNLAAGRFAAELAARGTTRIVLGHLSDKNNTPRLAFETVERELRRAGFDPGRDVRLLLARREEPSDALVW